MGGISTTWLVILVFIGFQLFKAAMFRTSVDVFDIVAISVLVLGLVGYVSLVGSQGSDVLGIGAGAISAIRAAFMVAFVAAIVALVTKDAIAAKGAPTAIVAFINAALGGIALFSGIGEAKPGAE